MKILVIGASGMLGSTMLRVLGQETNWDVFGTIRNSGAKRFFSNGLAARLIDGIDIEHDDVLLNLLEHIRPNVVINCAGLTKHKSEADNPSISIRINSLMPHRLASLCKLAGARLVHISTDCVFSGQKGHYTETDPADASDVYGKSKALGEVHYPHTITLRTSIIGHELQSNYSLLDWFLSQTGSCKGYTRAIFSGFPTVVFAQLIRDIVLPRNDLNGLYHVAAQPIAKFDLLKLIAKEYGKSIDIIADDKMVIDRSLDGSPFCAATGYVAPPWDEMIKTMHAFSLGFAQKRANTLQVIDRMRVI